MVKMVLFSILVVAAINISEIQGFAYYWQSFPDSGGLIGVPSFPPTPLQAGPSSDCDDKKKKESGEDSSGEPKEAAEGSDESKKEADEGGDESTKEEPAEEGGESKEESAEETEESKPDSKEAKDESGGGEEAEEKSTEESGDDEANGSEESNESEEAPAESGEGDEDKLESAALKESMEEAEAEEPPAESSEGGEQESKSSEGGEEETKESGEAKESKASEEEKKPEEKKKKEKKLKISYTKYSGFPPVQAVVYPGRYRTGYYRTYPVQAPSPVQYLRYSAPAPAIAAYPNRQYLPLTASSYPVAVRGAGVSYGSVIPAAPKIKSYVAPAFSAPRIVAQPNQGSVANYWQSGPLRTYRYTVL